MKIQDFEKRLIQDFEKRLSRLYIPQTVDPHVHFKQTKKPTMDPKAREADWLLNRVVLLIQDLKEASNEN